MVRQKGSPLNRLERELPEGLLVDTAWLKERGYSRQLLNHYVHAGWLEQPGRGVYSRPRGSLKWEQVVISLQVLLQTQLVVGGRSALELQGFAHYLKREIKEIYLYGPKRPPSWLYRLPIGVRFVYRNSSKLFANGADADKHLDNARRNIEKNNANADRPDLVIQPWGQWDWPLTLSSPERAILELLNELPAYESFHQVDMLFESLTSLRPRRLQKLLAECKSVKIKRLFFYFAARHSHAWLKKIDRKRVDLGSGKRVLVKGGKLDPITRITVPEDMNGVR
jgi:hypothetical protein